MYKVKLENFEGPLDLLLFFIKRDELNIYDIPISYITQEFLNYVRFLKSLDLEVAAEFIYMAAFLLSIKSRMLLPQPEADGDEDIEDPRTELVQRLLEYKRYKEMAGELEFLEEKQSLHYPREYFDQDKLLTDEEPEEELTIALKDISLWDLMLIYKRAIEEMPKPVIHEIKRIPVSVDDQIHWVKDRLKVKDRFSFREIFETITEKIVIVITFLALLEMAKLQEVSLYLNEDMSDFYVVRKELPADTDSENENNEDVN